MTKEDFLIKYSADKHANGSQWLMAMMQEYADQETEALKEKNGILQKEIQKLKHYLIRFNISVID